MQIELETALVEAAKSSLVFAYARKEKTVSAAANLAFGNEALKGLPLSFGRELLAKIQVRILNTLRPTLTEYPVRRRTVELAHHANGSPSIFWTLSFS